MKPAAPGTRPTPPSPGPQLPLTLRYPPDQRLDTFVGAAAGTIEQLQALADGGSDDWLYLSGPGGVGKTHLLLAVCAAAEASGRRRRSTKRVAARCCASGPGAAAGCWRRRHWTGC